MAGYKIMANNCHFPYFGSKDNFLPCVQVSKDLEDLEYYISSSRKYIKYLSKIDEETIQSFIEAPTTDMTLIKIVLPKMNEFEKRARKNIAYKAHFKQNHFLQIDALNQTFEAWNTYVRIWIREMDEASSSHMGKSFRGGNLYSQKGDLITRRVNSSTRGNGNSIEEPNKKEGEMNSQENVSIL